MSSDTRTERFKLLLIAESANPEWTSVPIVGWSHSQAISQLADVHLVTHIRNRNAISRAGLIEGRDFTVIDTEVLDRPMYRLASYMRGGREKGWSTITAFMSISYYLFEYSVWRHFGEDIKNRRFDIVHRLTPLTPSAPSLLAKRCYRVGVPFVIGPLNGGVPWPREFQHVRRLEKEWLSKVRYMYRLMPGYHATRKYASCIIVGSRVTFNQMPKRYWNKCVYIPENAIDTSRFTKQRNGGYKKPLKAIFVGRLVCLKGVDMLIEAAAPLIKRGDLVVDIIGEGPTRVNLEAQANVLGVRQGVQFYGKLPHTAIQDKLVDCDVFVFPSIREFGGAVVLEAMAVGIIPIVMNYGGPGELVTTQCGFLIPMSNRDAIIRQIHETLSRIIEQPDILTAKSKAGISRVHKYFTWEAKARQVLEVYQWVTGYGDKPEFQFAESSN